MSLDDAEKAARAALPFRSAVIAGLLNSFGLILKIFGPLAKLFSNVVPDRDPLQLAAPLSNRPELPRIHHNRPPGGSGAGPRETATPPGDARDEGKRREPLFLNMSRLGDVPSRLFARKFGPICARIPLESRLSRQFGIVRVNLVGASRIWLTTARDLAEQLAAAVDDAWKLCPQFWVASPHKFPQFRARKPDVLVVRGGEKKFQSLQMSN